MKVVAKMKSQFFYRWLITVIMVVITATMSGCFESNSEQPAPIAPGGGDNGGAALGVDDALSVPIDSSGGSIDVLRNDSTGVEITAFDASSAQNGTVSRDGSSGHFTYIPPAAFSGTDSFTYTLEDSAGHTSEITVNVTVNDDIIASGRDYFNRECGICHTAGSEDQQSAFNATDLVQSATNFDYDMSLSDQVWNPPLMRYYSNLSQKQLDGLRAYIGFLRNP
ncbi:MAG: Ig-like domain-containing protein [Gammaproteobacteria bacterium]|jgi:cytochrome c2|nr:Ig-like domain-containing protein [Gammaproteobacteria bacterium]